MCTDWTRAIPRGIPSGIPPSVNGPDAFEFIGRAAICICSIVVVVITVIIKCNCKYIILRVLCIAREAIFIRSAYDNYDHFSFNLEYYRLFIPLGQDD